MKSILLDEKLLGLVEMTSGLVNASFSLPEWQAVKMIFFAPWGARGLMSHPFPQFFFYYVTLITGRLMGVQLQLRFGKRFGSLRSLTSKAFSIVFTRRLRGSHV